MLVGGSGKLTSNPPHKLFPEMSLIDCLCVAEAAGILARIIIAEQEPHAVTATAFGVHIRWHNLTTTTSSGTDGRLQQLQQRERRLPSARRQERC